MKNFFTLYFLVAFGFIPSSLIAQTEFKNVVRRVVDEYPSVISSKNQIKAAYSDIESAKWNYYPTPSITYEKADKKISGVLNQDNTYFRLQQPLWTAGRLTAQRDKALSQLKIAENAMEEQRLSAAFKWLQTWAELQSTTIKVNSYKDSELKHRNYVTQIERRAAEGYSALTDVQLSLSRLSSVQSELRLSQFNQRQAIMKLEQMFKSSLPKNAVHSMNDEWPEDFVALLNRHSLEDMNLLGDALNKHPSIQKALASVQSAVADVALAQSKNLPEVYLRAEIRKGDITGTDRSVYIGLNSSFGAGLSNISAIASAQAKVEASQSELQGRRMDIEEVIRSDLQIYQSQSERIKQLEQTFENNRLYLESSERQYKAGRKTWQEIMNIAREEVQVQVQIADAKAQTWLAHQRLQIFADGLDGYLSLPAVVTENNPLNINIK